MIFTVLSFIGSFFSEALFFTAILVGGAIAAIGYAGGVFYGFKMPIPALIIVPLIVGIGASLSSGAFFYRQAVNGAEVKQQIAKEKAHAAGLQKSLDEIQKNDLAQKRANALLRIKIAEAEAKNKQFEIEVQEYESTNSIPTDGRVSDGLARRLRNK